MPLVEVIFILLLALNRCTAIVPSLVIVISPADANTSGGRFTPKPVSVPTSVIRLAYMPPKADASKSTVRALAAALAVAAFVA